MKLIHIYPFMNINLCRSIHALLMENVFIELDDYFTIRYIYRFHRIRNNFS